jgi:hypothetical protein
VVNNDISSLSELSSPSPACSDAGLLINETHKKLFSFIFYFSLKNFFMTMLIFYFIFSSFYFSFTLLFFSI